MLKLVKGFFVGMVIGVAGTLFAGISTKTWDNKASVSYEDMVVWARFDGYNQGYKKGYIQLEDIIHDLPEDKYYTEYLEAQDQYENDPSIENFDNLEKATEKVIIELPEIWQGTHK